MAELVPACTSSQRTASCSVPSPKPSPSMPVTSMGLQLVATALCQETDGHGPWACLHPVSGPLSLERPKGDAKDTEMNRKLVLAALRRTGEVPTCRHRVKQMTQTGLSVPGEVLRFSPTTTEGTLTMSLRHRVSVGGLMLQGRCQGLFPALCYHVPMFFFILCCANSLAMGCARSGYPSAQGHGSEVLSLSHSTPETSTLMWFSG